MVGSLKRFLDVVLILVVVEDGLRGGYVYPDRVHFFTS